jgi:hypothetical protein
VRSIRSAAGASDGDAPARAFTDSRRRGARGAAHRVRQSGEPPARPRGGARARDRTAAGARRNADSDRPAGASPRASCLAAAGAAAGLARGLVDAERADAHTADGRSRRCPLRAAPGTAGAGLRRRAGGLRRRRVRRASRARRRARPAAGCSGRECRDHLAAFPSQGGARRRPGRAVPRAARHVGLLARAA